MTATHKKQAEIFFADFKREGKRFKAQVGYVYDLFKAEIELRFTPDERKEIYKAEKLKYIEWVTVHSEITQENKAYMINAANNNTNATVMYNAKTILVKKIWEIIDEKEFKNIMR